MEDALLGVISLIFAVSAVVFVSGLFEMPPWYGVSAGLVATVTALVQMKLFAGRKQATQVDHDAEGSDGSNRKNGEKKETFGKKLDMFRIFSLIGMVVGGCAAVIGIVIYLMAWAWALR
jgi:hypothetical protein